MTENMRWRKSSYSGQNGDCVELAATTDGTAMRDSKLGDASPVLYFNRSELAAFLAGCKAGEFDDLG